MNYDGSNNTYNDLSANKEKEISCKTVNLLVPLN